MVKYSDEFKLKVVKEYLEGTVGYKLVIKYGIPAESQLKNGYVPIKNLVKMGYVESGQSKFILFNSN